MGGAPKRFRRGRGAPRRRKDLLLGCLAVAALLAPLVDRRPPSLASWWLPAWLAGLGVLAPGFVRRTGASPLGDAEAARALLAAVAAIHVLAVFRGLGASALVPAGLLDLCFPGGELSPWLGAYAFPVLAAAARFRGWLPAQAAWGAAALFEAVHLLLGEPVEPGSPRIAATAVSFAVLGLLGPLATAIFRAGHEKGEKLRREIAERDRFRKEAEEYRALSEHRRGPSAEDLSPRAAEKRISGVVADLGRDLDRVLGLARRAVGARTVLLLLLEGDGEHLVLRGVAEEAAGGPAVDRGVRVRLGEGMIGAAARTRLPALFSGLEPGSVRPPLYADGTPSPSLLVVPVEESEVLRGVLVADAARPGAFEPPHEQLLVGFAREVRELLEDARADAQRERRSHRHDALLFALAELSRTIKLDEVTERMVELTREIVAYERCAVYLAEPDGESLVLAAERGFGTRAGEEVRIPRDRHIPGYIALHDRPLLYSNLRELGRAVTVVPGAAGQHLIRSLLGLPLRHQDRVIGAWVLASEEPARFTAAHLDLLRAIADQAAILIANARLHREVERLAVTDGLTGLLNHRTFQERLGQEVERRDRTGQPLSLLLLDIDHFKRINDAHGHPFGDRVIRALAEELRRLARRVDAVARYGGEEFALVLVNTDRRGCAATARRVLKAVRALRVPREEGPFGFTASVGAATCPDDAGTREELVGAADRALYAAKAGGRDRAVAFHELR